MKLSSKLTMALLLIFSLSFTGCGIFSGSSAGDNQQPSTERLSAVGTPSTLDFGTWNLEWFGDPERGPENEEVQLENIHFILSGLDVDLWSVQEVTQNAHFESLLSQLDGYNGFLANDEFVVGGPEFYSDYDNNEQKVGLIYKSDIVSISSAQVILTDYDYEFAGRPPVEVVLDASVDNVSREFVVILLHAKCCTSDEDWERKSKASQALKSYLDQNRADDLVMVIGDFNDDVDTSISESKESVYLNFVVDSENYIFPTKALSEAGVSSTVFYPDVIDHHLTSDKLYKYYIDGSAISFPADEYIQDYGSSTSDHYPVLSRYLITN